MDDTQDVQARAAAARAAVDAAARVVGRDPADVRMLLATKTQPLERVLAVAAAGHRLFGENRVQEAVAKAPGLADVEHEMHFIGHLQGNKVNQLLPVISCLQTLDSLALARRLDARLELLERDLDVMVQVNVSGEDSKAGVPPEAAAELIAQVADLPRLRLRGLMTIGLNSPDRGAVRAGYRTLAELAAPLDVGGPVVLSMGMSGDFADAIAEGATMVRLGSAVFGARPPAS
ncbi:YggS family pyridoxal phosphate-dependent enzyme [Nakamurella flavida]|uniref:Pyridoxal phosphate homeostasis protein n=1 Tax=Nakamurella flavida TaxID=363630 RepID=A0A938YM05_9ACTN|nr:YggS family pyridoxal phosphate-dependent enzyme [Nakamurella flavida]MBM9478477.1 YggS family pyridoxal phosphate-dependent enzyme [Nakamurella flavida]MDP9777697.1 pyridoxal phosphate enzyme (YggS family) [Nakamurella flavida]